MNARPKRELHDLIERLSDEEAMRLSSALREGHYTRVVSPRPLTTADIILAEPIMPDDESADEMIETVRRWRREGGYA